MKLHIISQTARRRIVQTAKAVKAAVAKFDTNAIGVGRDWVAAPDCSIT
jgi:hypothetical protein